MVLMGNMCPLPTVRGCGNVRMRKWQSFTHLADCILDMVLERLDCLNRDTLLWWFFMLPLQLLKIVKFRDRACLGILRNIRSVMLRWFLSMKVNILELG